MVVTGMGTITGIGMDIMLVPEDITLTMIIMDMEGIMVTDHQGDQPIMVITHPILLRQAMSTLQEAQGHLTELQHAVQEPAIARQATIREALTGQMAKV